jgi:hypothetical protein
MEQVKHRKEREINIIEEPSIQWVTEDAQLLTQEFLNAESMVDQTTMT